MGAVPFLFSASVGTGRRQPKPRRRRPRRAIASPSPPTAKRTTDGGAGTVGGSADGKACRDLSGPVPNPTDTLVMSAVKSVPTVGKGPETLRKKLAGPRR